MYIAKLYPFCTSFTIHSKRSISGDTQSRISKPKNNSWKHKGSKTLQRGTTRIFKKLMTNKIQTCHLNTNCEATSFCPIGRWRKSIYVITIVFGIDMSVSWSWDEAVSVLSIIWFLGQLISEVVLVSMPTMADIGGRSPGVSWTQRMPISMHRFSSDKSSNSDS